MYLPGPIYESIPAVYLVSGVVSAILIQAPFSFVSTTFFCFASWMVWKMRRDYRRNKTTHSQDM